MKDGTVEVSRQDLYEQYVEQCTEVWPCRDAQLLSRAAQYLLGEPEPGGTFTVFPFCQAVTAGCQALSSDWRPHLSAVSKATELLETLCRNLYLQPWRKEIKTLKTFTGPFVYCLLPAFSSSTLQAVLASIGYLPNTDTPPSEFRLSEEANTDRAMLVGFELLLARVECYHLLELLDKDQLGPQEWLEVVQRRVQPTKVREHEEEEEEEQKEELDTKEVPLCLDTRLAVNPLPKPRRSHLFSVDQSIMEMQRIYPDLAFRGRPLLPDKPHKAQSSMSSSKAVRAAELPKGDCCFTGTKAEEVLGDDGRSSGGTTAPGVTINSNTVKRADGEHSGPQASLHITLRAGLKAEQSLKPTECQSTAEPPVWTQQQAGRPDRRLELPSLSSMDEEEELRQLEERMGHVCLQERKEAVQRKDNRRGDEGTKKAVREKEGEAAETSRRQQVMEAAPALSHEASRSSRSEPTVMKQQRQPVVRHPSLLTDSPARCQSCAEDGSTGQQEGRDPEASQAEGEQTGQSFVMVEHHKK